MKQELKEKFQNFHPIRKYKESSPRYKSMVLINVTMFIFCGLFFFMILYLSVFVLTSTIELYNNSYNNREEIQIRNVTRGTIYSSDGEILAETRTDENGNEFRYYPYGSISYQGQAFPEFMQKLIAAGGLVNFINEGK